MRQNRASRFNRTMMVGMMFMGIVVIGCVFFFLYWAGNAQEAKQQQEQQQAVGDSLVIEVTDSMFLIEE